MPDTKLSRRKVIGAAAVIPILGAAANAKAHRSDQGAAPDPLVARVEEWLATNKRVEALSIEADDLEGVLFAKAKALGVRGNKARENQMPEAKAWQAKKREFDEGSQLLEKLAWEVRGMQATTVAGAIAKIELSLHVQYEDWSEHAFEFVEDGIADLRKLTAKQQSIADVQD